MPSSFDPTAFKSLKDSANPAVEKMIIQHQLNALPLPQRDRRRVKLVWWRRKRRKKKKKDKNATTRYHRKKKLLPFDVLTETGSYRSPSPYARILLEPSFSGQDYRNPIPATPANRTIPQLPRSSAPTNVPKHMRNVPSSIDCINSSSKKTCCRFIILILVVRVVW